MKITWKVLIAFVLIVAATYWAVDSVRSHSYAGNKLNFETGRGVVTVTNPSTESVVAQLVSAGTRSFSVSSTFDGLSGSSVKQGEGSNVSHLFELNLPSGVSEFTVIPRTSTSSVVNFVMDIGPRLQVLVQPHTVSEARTTVIAAVVVVVVALFYISSVNGHRWINILRRKETPLFDLRPVAETAASNQGSAHRSYGDNRADTSR